MKVIVKFVKTMDRECGETDRGMWVRGGMVCRTVGDNERLLAFTAFGEEKTNMCAQFKVDSVLTVDFSPESREFNDRWFTDLRLIRATLLGAAPVETQKGGEQ